MSIEAFIAANLLMNIAVLSISARCMGHIRWKRVLSAAVIGTAYAAAAYLWWEKSWLRSAAAQFICLLLMAAVLFKHRRRRRHALMYLLASLVLTGGIMTLLSRWLSGGWLLLIGWITMAAAVFMGDRLKDSRQVDQSRICVRIDTRMGSTEVEALVDTGNRLTEPISGLPVLIVEDQLLRGIIDASCLYPYGKRLPPGFRVVRYGVLGGEGEMRCFRPKSVCVRATKGWIEAPDVWIGIYPGRMPNDIEALAPPVFGQLNTAQDGIRSGREHML